MADDIDDLLNCIEKRMNTKVKTLDSDEEGDKNLPACQSHADKTTSVKCRRK